MGQALYSKCRSVGSNRIVVNISHFLLRGHVLWAIVLPIFLAPVFIPTIVDASNSSCFFWIFCTPSVEAEEIDSNLQNMPLLQAVVSPDQTSSTTKDDVKIIGGTSLVSDSAQNSPDTKTIDDDQISLYVVHSGDTLPAIAKMFGVSVNTIKWGNDIKGSSVSVGQTLVILPISGVQHIVKKGDTVKSITKLHKGDIDEVLQYNNLTLDSKLNVGDVVVVPDGEMVAISSGTNSGLSVGKTGSSYPTYEGYYMRPIIGGIRTQGIHGHNGVDLASVYGANILASADGEVIISKNSGWNGGYGSYIVLKHNNGTQTLYGHLSAALVNVGDHVTQGQVIGKMGHSGSVNGPTGTHLHFEIRGARNPF